MCPTRYRNRHFFNNFTINEDIATKFEAGYRHIALHFSHNERTLVQYLYICMPSPYHRDVLLKTVLKNIF